MWTRSAISLACSDIPARLSSLAASPRIEKIFPSCPKSLSSGRDGFCPDAIGSIIETSTEDANLAQETGANTNEPEEAEDEGSYDTSDDSTDEGSADEGSADESTDNGTGIPDATGDGTYDNGDDSSWGTDEASTDESNGESTDSADQNAEGSYTEDTDGSAEQIPDAGTDESTDNGEQIPDESGEDTADTSDSEDALSAEDQGKYDQAQQFCQGEYTGDMAILQSIMPDPAQPVVTLDNDTATKLTKKVLEAYKTVLKDGGMTYVTIRNRQLYHFTGKYAGYNHETDLQY